MRADRPVPRLAVLLWRKLSVVSLVLVLLGLLHFLLLTTTLWRWRLDRTHSRYVLSNASLTEFDAIVIPFIASQTSGSLRNLQLWSEVTPCSEAYVKETEYQPHVDIVLYLNSKVFPNQEVETRVLEQVDAVASIRRCFRRLLIHYIEVPAARDSHIPGANFMFFHMTNFTTGSLGHERTRVLRHFQLPSVTTKTPVPPSARTSTGDVHLSPPSDGRKAAAVEKQRGPPLHPQDVESQPGYRYVFLMEPDCLPIREGWLPALEMLCCRWAPRFWIRGSIYRGTRDIRSEIDGVHAPNLYHINGNALYHVGDAGFQSFIRNQLKPYLEQKHFGPSPHAYDTDIFDWILDRHNYYEYREVAHYFFFADFVQNHWKSYYSVSRIRNRFPNTFFVHGGYRLA